MLVKLKNFLIFIYKLNKNLFILINTMYFNFYLHRKHPITINTEQTIVYISIVRSIKDIILTNIAQIFNIILIKHFAK